MSAAGNKGAAPKPAWQAARAQVKQLEAAAQRLSLTWFAGTAGVVAAAVLFLFTAIVLGVTLDRIQTHAAMARETENALRAASTLQESVDESSAAARVYLITRDSSLLRLRAQAKRSINAALAELTVRLKDDAAATQQLRTAAQVLATRLKVFDQLTTRQGSVRADEMRRIDLVLQSNAKLAVLRAHLRDVLTEHEDRIASYLSFAILLVLIAGAGAPLCGLVGIYLLRRERDSQRARELQMELMHVQRLTIMGETSTMLAHEINQPLAAANNYLSVLRRLLDSGAAEKAQPVLERISEQIQRTASILHKLRRFIEKRESERALESPEVIVEDAITLLGTIDNDVALETRIGASLPRVLVDRVQLQQVLVNLMRNAIEAMQNCPKRQLVLSVHSPDGKSIEVSLADTGPGLPQQVRERLFQPFISTKENGMGVGLSICRSIIAQHDGRIWAETNPDGGTTFRFTLPAVEERAAA